MQFPSTQYQKYNTSQFLFVYILVFQSYLVFLYMAASRALWCGRIFRTIGHIHPHVRQNRDPC